MKSGRKPSSGPGVWLVLCAGLCAVGCRAPQTPIAALSELDESKPPAKEAEDRPAEAEPASSKQELFFVSLASPAWIRTLPQVAAIPSHSQPTDRHGESPWRWTHPELAHLWTAGAASPDLTAALKHANPIVRGNAAICLTRLGSQTAIAQLATTVQAADAQLALRCAAAEALGHSADPSALGEVSRLLTEFGKFAPDSGVIYLPTLHEELVHAAATHATAGRKDPQMVALLEGAAQSPDATVRREAVEAFRQALSLPLPDRVKALGDDPSPAVRVAVLLTLAKRNDAKALAMAQASLTDAQLDVRLAAIEALGLLKGKASQAVLEKQLASREPDLIRAAAASALARQGAVSAVWAAADDKSTHVRVAVATSLARWPDRKVRELAERFLTDDSLEVQRQAVLAVETWPLEQAVPVLLAALEHSGYLTRKSAAAQLARRWSGAEPFPTDASAERRAEALLGLQQAWRLQSPATGLVRDQDIAASHVQGEPTEPAESAAQESEVRSILAELRQASPDSRRHTELLDNLKQFGQEAPELLQRAAEEGEPVPDAVYRDVLPAISPVFATLKQLQTGDPSERRRTATQLAEHAAKSPLPLLAVTRLAELEIAEPDPLVWAALFRTIANDPREPAVRLATAGASHGTAEVRRQACLYLSRNPAAGNVEVLLPLLSDGQESVVEEAARALGELNSLPDAAPLEAVLDRANPRLQLVAARSLCRLNRASGPPALERSAHHPQPELRRQVAMVMGELGRRDSVATLIEMLDDESLGARTAALDSLPLVAGAEPDSVDPTTADTVERTQRWKSWWAARGVEGTE